jgi:receptor protein-tyrosine kinase
MELSFVISALRRRFWVVTLLALLGSLPGLTADPPTSNVFESKAILLVQPPTRATVNFFSTDPDRYVTSQMSVLTSDSLAAEVAQRVSAQLGETVTAADLAGMVEIEQQPETDIVEVTTEAGSAVAAAAISQAYVELYVEGLATTDEDQVQRADLEREIETLTNRLSSLDERLQEAMRPYLPRSNDPTPDPIPPAENVDPSAVSQRQLVLAELSQLQDSLNELEAQSRLRVNTEIISNAAVPLEPNPRGGNFLLAGGLLGGIVLGVVVTLMWARFSTKVLDEVSAGELLGAPVVSEIPHYRSLARNPIAAFQALPRSAVPTIDQLCVRAEALAPINEPLTVAVTGTMRSAGSTTLALAMAERFAAGGASVVLVDADVRDPRITALFNATADGGVPAVIATGGSLTDVQGRSALTRTMDPAVSVLGLGPNRGSAALRRDTVPTVLEGAHRKADIVVVDGGPVLDLASTIYAASLADAVVLAVPLARQKADALADMARQLGSVRHKLLPVVTAPSRRPAKGKVVRADGAIAMPGLTTKPGSSPGAQAGPTVGHAPPASEPSPTQQPLPGQPPTPAPTQEPAQAQPQQPQTTTAAPAAPAAPTVAPGGQPASPGSNGLFGDENGFTILGPDGPGGENPQVGPILGPAGDPINGPER